MIIFPFLKLNSYFCTIICLMPVAFLCSSRCNGCYAVMLLTSVCSGIDSKVFGAV